MRDYRIELIKQVSNSVNITVIAAGGAGAPEGCLEAVTTEGRADAVARGKHVSFSDENTEQHQISYAKSWD